MPIKERFKAIANIFKSKEQYYPSGQEWLRDLMTRGAGYGGGFLSDIYLDRVLTPHEEMYECEKMYRENAFITSVVELLKDIIIGRELTVETEDDATREFYEKWFRTSGYYRALGEAIENFIKCGNGYIQILRGLETGIPKKALAIPRVWNIWILKEKDENGNERLRYIEELPRYSKGEGVKNFTVYYEKDSTYKKRIRGIEYKNYIQHFKWGISHVSLYGRSPLASALSDGKILREIERAMAVIARYKAIPRKVINITNPDGTPVESTEINEIIEYWNSLSDLENPVIGGKKVELQDLSYSGRELNFQVMIDYLKRKITTAFAPDFYVHGDVTTYAVALEQKNLFYLRVMALRRMIEEQINELLEEIRIKNNSLPRSKRGHNWILLHPAKVKFGEFDFETKEEERALALNLWNAGLITLNETRVMLGLDTIKEDFGDAYKWELQAGIPSEVFRTPRMKMRVFDEDEKGSNREC